MTQREPEFAVRALSTASERVAVVGLVTGRRGNADRTLDELARLVRAAGATPVVFLLQERRSADPTRYLGRGKLEELAAACATSAIDVVVIDAELSPGQRRHLEGAVERPVVDRTQLILDIFARRAKTREGKLQVELAQLRYLLPRLAGAGHALSRLGGGIGTRGPGETKLEIDRRKIRRRIATIVRQLELVRQRRARLRFSRTKRRIPTVALVGYTNAGKTTLFNRLTGDDAVVSDTLFMTLDPLLRRLRLPDRRLVLCSDTVGFLERLPHALVAAFRATLEEVAEADVLLHVSDASSPSYDQHEAAVSGVLQEIGADGIPCVTVLNKCDLLNPADLARLRRQRPEAVCLSATDQASGEVVCRVIEHALAATGVSVGAAAPSGEAGGQTSAARVAQVR